MKNYIVLDLEWNQSPDGKEGAVQDLPFEIMEIGAVKLDLAFQEVSCFQGLVKPKAYQQLHYKISEVTHMDMAQLQDQGEDFQVVVSRFLEWCGEDFTFCTWGSMDLTELQRNMAYYGMEIPFEKPLLYYDVQKLYCLLWGDGKNKHSLDQAVEQLGAMEARPFHRALDDAHYTGRVMARAGFQQVMDYYSVDYYRLPDCLEDEIYLVFPNYSKYVSRTFDSKEEAISDKRVTDMVCCQCRRMLRKKIRWFSSNQRFYFCLAVCPEHGYVKGKIRMKRADNGGIYVVKTMKLVDEEEAKRIIDKKAEAMNKKSGKSKSHKPDKSEKAWEAV